MACGLTNKVKWLLNILGEFMIYVQNNTTT